MVSGVRRAGAFLGVVALLGSAPSEAAAEPGGTIMGTVTGAGVALANTWVTLTALDSRGQPTGQPQRTVTDATGRYEFPTLATGPVKLQARAPLGGSLVDTYWPRAFTLDTAGVFEASTGWVRADIDLPEGGSAQGQVVEARTGNPVVGARVTASVAGERPSGNVGTSRPVAGPGEFLLDGLPPVPLELSVSVPRDSPYLPSAAGPSEDRESLRLDGGERTTGLTIGLLRGAVYSGTVRDDAGAPLVGAEVTLVGCRPACPPPARTDANGSYQLAGVAPASGLSVIAQPTWELLGPWYPSRESTARVTDLEVAEGDVVESVDVTVPRPAFLSLDVLGAGSEQLRAVVRLTTTGRTYSQYLTSPSTADGQPPDAIRLREGPVPPGEYSVSIGQGVADPGYLPSRWVSDTGTPSSPTIRLGAGENRSVISLEPAGGDQDVPIGAEPGRAPLSADAAGGWPGLAQGFLAPSRWTALGTSS